VWEEIGMGKGKFQVRRVGDTMAKNLICTYACSEC